MTSKTVKLEIPFQNLLTIIEQLDPGEKLILKNKLQRQAAMTWQSVFAQSLKTLDDKNNSITETDVSTDVNAAIAELMRGAKN
ncbi:MAG: hypothetical protein L7F77_07875 [Candidatus Magnetominusculus sp. LBB02]|nr:hypothetical protein [Candidatus Magnetominusculus sp. LBB02]